MFYTKIRIYCVTSFKIITMKILLTGANGYIGMRLLPLLLEKGHDITCAVRDKSRLSVDKETLKQIKIVEVDFLEEVNKGNI